MKQRIGIEVRGIVQGVGFRPFVYRLAHEQHLSGSIRNAETGVIIEVQGSPEELNSFVEYLEKKAPPLAQLHEVRTYSLEIFEEAGFVILESSRSSSADTLLSPDIATCTDCVAELLDPANRRHLYPFINCTNCGPRFTITRSIPYDRRLTSMASFPLCELCRHEYDDPLDRRFHAQPNACWQCGPQLDLVDNRGVSVAGDSVSHAIDLLQQGFILAIKGLGGFHLAVDANQPQAVTKLRERKNRGEKPFAVMVANVEAAARLCLVSESAATLLESPQRPIVLLPKLSAEFNTLAPDGNELGVFLAYTPLHHLLLSSAALPAIIMTSGNLSDEPIAIDNQEALSRLSNIADFFLIHNRDILLRCDDSVVRSLAGETQLVRRSRGYVPAPIVLGKKNPPILAVGGELKNVICISRGSYAFPGQHIGDMQDLAAYDFFQESIHHLQNILEVRPEIIAHDLHPGYLATQWAKRQPDARLVGVQHHHAHIASCMAENHLEGPVIGIALDGTGYGTDGQIWGGEILVADLQGFERAAHLAYTLMPGGDKAINEPWRMAVAYLRQTFGTDWRNHLPPSAPRIFFSRQAELVEQLLLGKTPLPLTSSCGRLFDAVAALVCGRTLVSYEAQAAIALEACCDPRTDLGAYTFSIAEGNPLQIETSSLFVGVVKDLVDEVAPGIISRRFHNGLSRVFAELANRIAQSKGLTQVCLSGGAFQNAILSREIKSILSELGLTVFTHSVLPPGDGGLSVGQLVIAAAQLAL